MHWATPVNKTPMIESQVPAGMGLIDYY